MNIYKDLINLARAHEQKLKIGDVVVTKRLGLPASGCVVAVLSAPFYGLRAEFAGSTNVLALWDEHYPDWKCKYVYFLGFDPGVAPSVQARQFPHLEESLVFAPYPEDDLEVFEC